MHLTYQLREEDMAAYARHAATVPGKIRALLRRNELLFAVIYATVLTITLLFIVHIRLPITLTIAVITTILFYFVYKPVAVSRYVSRVIKLSSTGNSFQVRNCSLDIAEDGLHTASELGTATIFWSSIQRTEETPDYVFLIVQNVNAVIIPKRAFATSTAFQEFHEMINMYLQQSGSSSLKSSDPSRG